MTRKQLINLIKSFYPSSETFDTTAEQLADEILKEVVKTLITTFSIGNAEYKPSEDQLKQLVTGE